MTRVLAVTQVSRLRELSGLFAHAQEFVLLIDDVRARSALVERNSELFEIFNLLARLRRQVRNGRRK
jgi:hypothetical protein